jgi:opacity protein-like surface antigen
MVCAFPATPTASQPIHVAVLLPEARDFCSFQAATDCMREPMIRKFALGLTLGAGAEHKLTRNWSAKIEYDYVNFGDYRWTDVNNANYGCAGINCSTDAGFHVVRFGLNYRF